MDFILAIKGAVSEDEMKVFIAGMEGVTNHYYRAYIDGEYHSSETLFMFNEDIVEIKKFGLIGCYEPPIGQANKEPYYSESKSFILHDGLDRALNAEKYIWGDRKVRSNNNFIFAYPNKDTGNDCIDFIANKELYFCDIMRQDSTTFAVLANSNYYAYKFIEFSKLLEKEYSIYNEALLNNDEEGIFYHVQE